MSRMHRSRVTHDRWLVSYADFITLLFAFFVVLYAFAKADQKKQRAVYAFLHEQVQSGAEATLEVQTTRAAPRGRNVSAEGMIWPKRW